MWVVIFKQHGAPNCAQQVVGPFANYYDAEEALSDGRVPLLFGQGGRSYPDNADRQVDNGYRYVQEVTAPEEAREATSYSGGDEY